jgi:hypothetical protein
MSLPERKTVRSPLLRFSEIFSEASNAAARGPQLIRQDPPEVKPRKRAVSILNRYSPEWMSKIFMGVTPARQ